MKVKIGKTMYDSAYEPIMLVLDDLDKSNITNMRPEATRYCSFPNDIPQEDIKEFMGEISEPNLMNLEYLKRNCQRIYFFGLGFIQVVLNQYERVHFYSDKLKDLSISEGWHNHRYNFTSKILKGDFRQSLGVITNGDTHILYNVNCGTGKDLPYSTEIPIGLQEVIMPCGYLTEHYGKGDSYNIFYNDFHYVTTLGNTITYLKRGDYITEFAQAIREKDQVFQCPFTHKFTDEELWEIVEEIINN